MKYIISIILAVGIAYIQSTSLNQDPGFASGFKPAIFHYVVTTIFFLIAGLIVSYQLRKDSGESETGFWEISESFTFVFTVALAVGVFGAIDNNDNFMSLMAPYFGFSLAFGLVIGKVIFIFKDRNSR